MKGTKKHDFNVGLSTDAGSNGRDIVGYDVEATDGSIGKIDEASVAAGRLPGRRHRILDLRQEAADPSRRRPADRRRSETGVRDPDEGRDQVGAGLRRAAIERSGTTTTPITARTPARRSISQVRREPSNMKMRMKFVRGHGHARTAGRSHRVHGNFPNMKMRTNFVAATGPRMLGGQGRAADSPTATGSPPPDQPTVARPRPPATTPRRRSGRAAHREALRVPRTARRRA